MADYFEPNQGGDVHEKDQNQSALDQDQIKIDVQDEEKKATDEHKEKPEGSVVTNKTKKSKGATTTKKSTASKSKDIRAKEDAKKNLKMSAKEKAEMELMRRWKIKINNIKAVNLQAENIDVFLQFVIGGDYGEDFRITPGGKKEYYIGGTRGPNFKTELLGEVVQEETRSLQKTFEDEYIGSYLQLEEERFEIEVWSYSRTTVNTYMGKLSVPLSKIASGPMHRSDTIIHAKERKGFIKVKYTIVFQEVWDFNMEFADWRTTDLQMDKSKDSTINPQIKLILQTSDLKKPAVETSVLKHARAPHWENLEGKIWYRGTIDDLESLRLRTILYDVRTIGWTTLADKTISLRGVIDFGIVKSFVNLGKKRKTLTKEEKERMEEEEKERQTMMAKSQARSTYKDDGSDEDDLVDKNDDIFQDESIKIKIEGRVKIGNVPRFRQSGEISRLKKKNVYLAVNIIRAEKIQAPESRAVINTYVSVEWGGQIKKTVTEYDNYSPTFNQEFYYEIPAKKKNLVKQLQDEFATNNIVNVDLWLEGEDGTSDNLGNTSFTIAEIENGQLDQRVFNDHKTRKDVRYQPRVLETNLNLESAHVQGTAAKILIEVWFVNLPEEINLRDYSLARKDVYPLELEYNKNEQIFLHKYLEKLNSNFVTAPLEGDRKRNMQTVFAKDQYNKEHFLSMYLEKYTLDQYNIEKDLTSEEDWKDRRCMTMSELAHYVRTIPFKTESKNPEIWNTPNFLSVTKKGDVQDHCLLLACLFMGIKKQELEDDEEVNEDEDDDVEYPSIENRTFVCIGTHKMTKSTHFWVMTFNRKCSKITFWETTSNDKYVLEKRVENNEREDLMFFLSSRTKDVKGQEQHKGGLFGFVGGLGKGIFGGKGKGQKGGDGEEEKTEKSKKEKKNKSRFKVQIEEPEVQEVGEYKIEEEQIQPISEDPIGLDPNLGRTTVLRSAFLHKMQNDLYDEGDDKKQQPGFKNRNRPAAHDEPADEKKSFISNQKKRERAEEAGNKYKHLKPVLKFDEGARHILPYASIDIIFNHKNVWANMQFPHPGKIYYHLHNPVEWRPYFFVYNDVFIPDNEDFDDKKVIVWRDPIGVCYSFSSMAPPIRSHEIKRVKEDITKAVKFGVEAHRSGANLQTVWKGPKDKITKHLEEFLRLKERKDKEVLKPHEYIEQYEHWKIQLKKYMPEYYKYQCLPMFFSFSEAERIKSAVTKEAKSFFMVEEKDIIFALACKIFPYPGEFNSIRIALAVFVPLPDEEISSEEGSQDADFDDLDEKKFDENEQWLDGIEQ